MSEMKLAEKIINIRVELQNCKLKKSGKNKHAGFSYYELSDFLPKLNELMLKYKVNDSFSIDREMAFLNLINAEDQTDREIYSMPFKMFDVPVSSKGNPMMQEIQYLGALNTYIKRYLYLNAFGITDGEVIDSMDNSELKQKPTPNQNQWPKIIEKYKTGNVDFDEITKNFHLTETQIKELQNA